MSSPHSQQESKMQYLDTISEQQNDLCFQDKPLNITIIQVYVPITNAKEVEVEWFSEDLQDFLELTPKKMSFSTDIKKRWQEYTEELYNKDLHDQDDHDGVITQLEPDILECEI